jgi:hypothetical protein
MENKPKPTTTVGQDYAFVYQKKKESYALDMSRKEAGKFLLGMPGG